MPIDSNLINWNKENEPHTTTRRFSNASTMKSSMNAQLPNYTLVVTKQPLNLQHSSTSIHHRQSTIATAMEHCQLNMSTKSAAVPENGTTPKCRRFLKRSSNFVQEEYIHLQKSIFANTTNIADERKRTAPSVDDEDELLALCSWWSDSENFYDDESSGNEEEEEEESYFKAYVLADRHTTTEMMAVAQRAPSKRHESGGSAGEPNDLDEFFRADFFGHETDEPDGFEEEDEAGEDSVDGPLTTMSISATATLRRLPTEFDLEASF